MNIYLNKISEKDFSKIIKWKSDLVLASQIMSQFQIINKTEAIKWIITNSTDPNQRLNGIYTKTAEDRNDLIGMTRLMFIDFDAKIAEFGIYIGEESYQGKGIGKQALILTIDQAFENLKLNKIYLRVGSNNSRAINMYKKQGFTAEGIMKEHYLNLKSNKYEDVMYMALFKDNLQ